MKSETANLDDLKVQMKFKLSALWASLTLCFIYGDYFGLYKPGKLQGILEGRMGPLGQITQGVLLGTAAFMATPCLMVCISILLKPVVSRWASIVFGLLFTAIMLKTMPGTWNFYIFMGVVEVALTTTIVWRAFRWPRRITA